jgi:hypothetical protein
MFSDFLLPRSRHRDGDVPFNGALAAFRVELVLVVMPADGGALPPHTDSP